MLCRSCRPCRICASRSPDPGAAPELVGGGLRNATAAATGAGGGVPAAEGSGGGAGAPTGGGGGGGGGIEDADKAAGAGGLTAGAGGLGLRAGGGRADLVAKPLRFGARDGGGEAGGLADCGGGRGGVLDSVGPARNIGKLRSVLSGFGGGVGPDLLGEWPSIAAATCAACWAGVRSTTLPDASGSELPAKLKSTISSSKWSRRRLLLSR